MESPQNLHVINARPVPELATAINQWLAARGNFKMQSTDEARHNYEATLWNVSVRSSPLA